MLLYNVVPGTGKMQTLSPTGVYVYSYLQSQRIAGHLAYFMTSYTPTYLPSRRLAICMNCEMLCGFASGPDFEPTQFFGWMFQE
jgi:hypothetical protein